jgi:hypothetical protein
MIEKYSSKKSGKSGKEYGASMRVPNCQFRIDSMKRYL